VLAVAGLVASEGYLQAAMLVKGQPKLLMVMRTGVLTEAQMVFVKSRPTLNCLELV
jgi:hypothetical protein